jgi:hypothetical protein
LWLVLLLLALFTALFLQALWYFCRRHGVVKATLVVFRFSDSLFYVISAFFQQGAYPCCCLPRAASATIPEKFPAVHN